MAVYVYVLQSQKDHQHYIGITKDLDDRLQRHNASQVPSTKGRIPFHLLFWEEFATYGEARKKEKFLKSGQGRSFLDKVIFHASVVEPADTPA